MLGAGIKAGKAFVEFVLSDKKLDGQLAAVGQQMQKFGSIGVAATAPIIAGFTAAALTFANFGSALADMSGRTGQSVQNLSELKFAAEQTGTEIGVVEKAFRELQSKGIDPARFDEIAADLAAIEDPTQRAAAAMDLFGKRNGTALLPMLESLPQLRAQARALGVTLSDEDAAAADELGDALDAAKAQFQALVVQIGAAIAGPLTEFLVWSQGMVAGVIQFVQENPNMVAAIAATTAAIAAVSAAAVVFGTILTIISLHPIIAALTLIAGLVVGVATYFGLASGAAGDFKKSLDGVKVPGAPGGPNPFAGQARQAQSQLRGALAGGGAGASGSDPFAEKLAEIAKWSQKIATTTAAFTSPLVTIAKAVAAPSGQGNNAAVEKNTREIADGIRELIQIARFNPVTAPSALLASFLP